MTSDKYPASLPRRMHWSNDIGGHTICPDCGTPLESEHHAYMLVTRRGGEMDFHIVGNTAGNFCERCPLLVLDREKFENFVAIAARPRGGVEYMVMGIIDLDAVPEDKKGLPFDDDTNPVPLVEFTNVGGKKPSLRSTPSRSSAPKRSGRRKRKTRQKKQLIEPPCRTPQTLVGGPRADAALMASSGRTAATKAMGKGSTQFQHLVQTEMPKKLLDRQQRVGAGACGVGL